MHIFINAIKKIEPECRFVTPSKYYKSYFTLNILYDFMYYVYPILWTYFQFYINVSKSSTDYKVKIKDGYMVKDCFLKSINTSK